MREKSTSFKSLFGGLIAIGLVALFAVFQFGPVDLSMLPSFDRGGELPIVAELDAVGKVQILDAEMGASSEFRLTSIEPDAAMIQTASIREAVKMMAGPPCDVVDCANTGMPFTVIGSCGGLIQEAETGLLSGGFTVGNDALASGGQYVQAPTNLGSRVTIDTSQKVSYCFTITQAGTYRIKANVYAANGSQDSLHVQVNGAPVSGYLWDTLINTAYQTDYVSDRGGADPVEVTLAAGDHIIDFFLREPGTRLDIVELEPAAPIGPTCAGLVQEAETGLVSGGFTVGNDALASGGQYVQAPTNLGGRVTIDTSQKVSYCFTTTQAGTYRIKTNVYAANGAQDSLHVQVNSAPVSGYLWDTLINTAYQTDYVSDRGGADPVEITLAAGDHIIDFFLREPGTRLDIVELEPAAPAGPTCAGLVQEAETGLVSGGFTAGNDALASGGQYVQAPTNLGGRVTIDTSQKVSYCFTITQAGTYRIKTNVYASNGAQDSLHVQVNGAPVSGYLWDTLINTAYQTDYVSDRGGADPVEITLAVGEHIVDFFLREPGTRLDIVELEVAGVAAAGIQANSSPRSSAAAIGVQGVVRVDTNHADSIGIDKLELAGIRITIRDAETDGQIFAMSSTTDRYGRYFQEGMLPGKYVVTLKAPVGYRTSTSNSNIVEIQEAVASNISFDLMPIGPDAMHIDTEIKNRIFIPYVE